ncbi:hypothetical protein [Paraburkholderia ferrariae]|uniref:hypothetical protein n=1 Tax=Paraburkholderia ferrariae TaxID=386056 RepID=UPI0012EC4F32|nr:hypothetical protein [Paraburkholderia ferrariae]
MIQQLRYVAWGFKWRQMPGAAEHAHDRMRNAGEHLGLQRRYAVDPIQFARNHKGRHGNRAHCRRNIFLTNGSFSDTDRAAHATKNASIGRLLREAAARFGELPALPLSPDVAALAVEIGFACLKLGYLQEGRIDTVIRNEALRAVMAYLDQWRDNHESA